MNNRKKLLISLFIIMSNSLDGMATSALIRAVQHNDIKLVQKLIKDGVNVNSEDEKDFSALNNALYYGFVPLIKILIEAGADVNAQTGSGGAPLHGVIFACTNKVIPEKDAVEIIKMLIAREADVNSKNIYNVSPLECPHSPKSIDRVLILAGADACKRYALKDKNYAELLQRASLLTQTNYYEDETEDIFSIKNSSARIKSPTLYKQFYDSIVKNNLTEVQNLLTQSDANKLINYADQLGGTLLIYAAILGRQEIVELLLQYGATTNVAAHHGKTLFVIIARMIDGGELMPVQQERYATILNWCYVQLYYCISCMQLALKKTHKQPLLADIAKALIPFLAGTTCMIPKDKSIAYPSFIKKPETENSVLSFFNFLTY